MVGAGLLGLLLTVIWFQSLAFGLLCIAGALLGALMANPFRLLARIRNHTIYEPVFRIRPLGVFGFVLFLIFLLVPYAVGDWLLTLIGERFESSRAEPPEDDTFEEDPLAGYDTMFTPQPKAKWLQRWGIRGTRS
jgi:hypothetical protein